MRSKFCSLSLKPISYIILALVLVFPSHAFSQSGEEINDIPFVKSWLGSLPDIRSGARPELPKVFTPRRKALVVGNWSYEKLRPMPGVENDFNGTIAKLESDDFDFDVTDVGNILNMEDYEAHLIGFLSSLQQNDIVVVYYSGHGLNYDGQNYILPTNTPKTIESDDLLSEAINLNILVQKIWERYPSYVFVVFDACRVDPDFKVSDTAVKTKGIYDNIYRNPAYYKHPNTYFLFASKTGRPADAPIDELQYSVFTEGLLQRIKPSDQVETIASEVRAYVENRTSPVQYPTGLSWSSTITKLVKGSQDYASDKASWVKTLEELIAFSRATQDEYAMDLLNEFISKNSTSPYVTQAKYIKRYALLRKTPKNPNISKLAANGIKLELANSSSLNGDLVLRTAVPARELAENRNYGLVTGYSVDLNIKQGYFNNSGEVKTESIFDKVLQRNSGRTIQTIAEPQILSDGSTVDSNAEIFAKIRAGEPDGQIRVLVQPDDSSFGKALMIVADKPFTEHHSIVQADIPVLQNRER